MANALNDLHVLLHQIFLKTKTAKTTSIYVNTLHAARKLTTSACAALERSYVSFNIYSVYQRTLTRVFFWCAACRASSLVQYTKNAT
ncbi:hypothetical protein K439DRAFT_1136931 [Ramaria rubella]|nr:hypothetical protein K439DRAFT_1136931 [Ramaria rubella]